MLASNRLVRPCADCAGFDKATTRPMAQLNTDSIAEGPRYRRAFDWSRALAGLTPLVVLGVAALLFVRMISSSLDKAVVAIQNHDLVGWISRLLAIYGTLLVMAAPMLVGIIATANLGPQRGAKRAAALAAAVVVSTGIGVLLRVALAQYFHVGSGWTRIHAYLLYTWPRYAVLGGLLTVVGEFYRHEVMSLRAMREAEADRETFEREMVEAAAAGLAGPDRAPFPVQHARQRPASLREGPSGRQNDARESDALSRGRSAAHARQHLDARRRRRAHRSVSAHPADTDGEAACLQHRHSGVAARGVPFPQ